MTTWIQTYTGRQYWPLTPRAQDVCIEDIAHALSMICRYAGHCTRFYSVAEHSVHVSRICEPEHAFEGLMHDAAEAYLCDLPRPLKRQIEEYRIAETDNWVVICKKFGLPRELHESVHNADYAMLHIERAQLMAPSRGDWGLQGEAPKFSESLGLYPTAAKRLFLERFNELYRKV